MSSFTITSGITGPGQSVVTETLENVSKVTFDLDRSVCAVVADGITREFDYYVTTTITITKSSQVTTATIAGA